MDNSLTFRNITYLGSLFLIIGLFVQFDNSLKQAIFDLTYNLIAITTFTFGYLWLRKRIMLIGLISYGISWNINLLTNPLTLFENRQLFSINFGLIYIIFNVIGLICLILGTTENFKQGYLTKEINFSIKKTIGFLIGFTFLIQLMIRTLI